MMPHGDHMVLNDDQMLPHMGHMMPDRDHMTPDRDHMMPHIDQAMSDEDHVMPNNDWVFQDDHNKDHMMHNVDHMRSTTDQMTPSMGPPMDHMMSYDNQVSHHTPDYCNIICGCHRYMDYQMTLLPYMLPGQRETSVSICHNAP